MPMYLQAGLQEDGQALLQMNEDDKPLAHMIVDASMLGAIIHQLGELRARMAEEVAPELDPGSRLQTLPSPAWKVPDTHSGPPGALLALRHPGLGWLGFHFEPERADAIGKALLRLQKQ